MSCVDDCTTPTNEYDIVISKGASLSLPVTVTGYSLTGASAKMQIRKSYGSDVLLELSTANGKLAIVGNILTINISASDSASLPVGNMLYDVFITAADTSKLKLMFGKVVVGNSVTTF